MNERHTDKLNEKIIALLRQGQRTDAAFGCAFGIIIGVIGTILIGWAL